MDTRSHGSTPPRQDQNLLSGIRLPQRASVLPNYMSANALDISSQSPSFNSVQHSVSRSAAHTVPEHLLSASFGTSLPESSTLSASGAAHRVRSGSSGTPTRSEAVGGFQRHTGTNAGAGSPSSAVVRMSGEALGISADMLDTSLSADGGSRFTLYNVAVKAPCGQWTVSRRFREFDSLHTALRSKAPAAQQRSLPSLPPKRVFGTMDSSVVAERRSQLGHFLRRLMTLPGLFAAVPELVEFLDDTSHPLRGWLSMQSMSTHLLGLQSAYAQSQAQISALETRLNTLEGRPRAPSTDTHEAGRAAMEAALAGLGSASPGMAPMRPSSPPPQHAWQRGLGASPFVEHLSIGLDASAQAEQSNGGGMQRGWGGVPSLAPPVSLAAPPIVSLGNSSGTSVVRAQQMVTRCLRSSHALLSVDNGSTLRSFAHAAADHMPELHAAIDLLICASLGMYKGLTPPPTGMTHVLLTLVQGGANARAYTVGATAAGVSPIWQPKDVTVLTPQGGQGTTLHRISSAATAVCQLVRRWQVQARASAGKSAAFAAAQNTGMHHRGERGVRSVSGTLLQSFSGGLDFDSMTFSPPPSRNRSTASATGGMQGMQGGGSVSRRVSAQSWTMDGRHRGSSVASASFTVGGDRVRAVNAALSAMDKTQLLTGSATAKPGSEAPSTSQQVAVQHTTALTVACMGTGNEAAARMAAGALGGSRAAPALLHVTGVQLSWPHQQPLAAASQLHLKVGPAGGPSGRITTNDLRSMCCAALVHAMSEHIGDETSLFRRSLVLLHAWAACDAARWGHQWGHCSQDEGMRAFDPPVVQFELPWEACVTLLTWTFARRGAVISTPLQALAWTLFDAASVPWATHVLEAQGITPRTEVAWTSRMAAAQAVAAALSATARRVPLAERSSSDEKRVGADTPSASPESSSRFLSREEAVAAAGAAVAPLFAELEAWGQEGGVEWPDESAASTLTGEGGGSIGGGADGYGLGCMEWLGQDEEQEHDGEAAQEGGVNGGAPPSNSPRLPPQEQRNSPPSNASGAPMLPYGTLSSLRRKCGRRRAAEDVALCIALMRQWGAAGDERGVLGLPLHVAHSMVTQVVDAAVEGGAGGSISGAPMGIMHPSDPLQNTLQGWSREQCVALQRSFATGAALLAQALQQEQGTPGWEGAYRGSSATAVHLMLHGSWERCIKGVQGERSSSGSSAGGGDGGDVDVGRLLSQVQNQCGTSEGRAGARAAAVAAVRRGAPAPALWHAVEFGAFYLDSDVTDAALLMLTREVLLTRGPLPVGEVGKHLGEATSNGNLSAALKEKFGGLKKFLERHAGEFLLGADHPFNPHVYLRALLGPEQVRQVEQSPTPVISGNTGPAGGGAPASSTSSGRKRRGGRRGKSAAAAAAAAAASAATAAVASAPLHTLVAPRGAMHMNAQFVPSYPSLGGGIMGTTPPSPHSGSLGSSFMEYDDSASRGSDSSSAGGGFTTPPPRNQVPEGLWGGGFQNTFAAPWGQHAGQPGDQFNVVWGNAAGGVE